MLGAPKKTQNQLFLKLLTPKHSIMFCIFSFTEEKKKGNSKISPRWISTQNG